MSGHNAERRPPIRIMDDGDLLARVRSGDEAVASTAFEALYARDYAVVWKFAYRFVGTRDAAQDLAQDVFLSLWRRRTSLHVRESLRTYLLAAVRLRALDMRRHERAEQTLEDRLRVVDPFVAMGSGGERPDDEAALALVEERISRAMATLPERQRSAFLLRWEQGLSNREIAHVLGVGEAAVSRLLTRAAETLRSIM